MVSGFYSKHDEGAPGRSQLGTGETSNPNPAAQDSDGSLRFNVNPEITLPNLE